MYYKTHIYNLEFLLLFISCLFTFIFFIPNPLALHPYCKLSPAILMTKCYSWKSAVEKGSMNIESNSATGVGLKSNSSNEHHQPKMRPRSSSKDLGKNLKKK